MKKINSRIALFALVATCSALSVAQGRLVAVDSNRTLYEVNMTNGTLTNIGAVSSNAGTTGGLAYDASSGTMFVTSTSLDSLFTLDLVTGTATLVGAYGVNNVMHGLEWDSSTGTLYGASSTPNDFYSVNTGTGVATIVGGIGLTSFNNLGYNSATNVMYMTNSSTDSFYSINRATGTPTLIGALGGGSTNANGLAFNSNNGLMYMVDNSADNLYTIDMATGAATVVGAMGSSNLLGLAYIPDAIPEPATMAILGIATLAAMRKRRKV